MLFLCNPVFFREPWRSAFPPRWGCPHPPCRDFKTRRGTTSFYTLKATARPSASPAGELAGSLSTNRCCLFESHRSFGMSTKCSFPADVFSDDHYRWRFCPSPSRPGQQPSHPILFFRACFRPQFFPPRFWRADESTPLFFHARAHLLVIRSISQRLCYDRLRLSVSAQSLYFSPNHKFSLRHVSQDLINLFS